ncbi:unnamed protein product [Amoebophrya sp. A120]|nr:unnamed protein product [Amoebophrya sp. A120]|eukprot:GSA120T00018123001.1
MWRPFSISSELRRPRPSKSKGLSSHQASHLISSLSFVHTTKDARFLREKNYEAFFPFASSRLFSYSARPPFRTSEENKDKILTAHNRNSPHAFVPARSFVGVAVERNSSQRRQRGGLSEGRRNFLSHCPYARPGPRRNFTTMPTIFDKILDKEILSLVALQLHPSRQRGVGRATYIGTWAYRRLVLMPAALFLFL